MSHALADRGPGVRRSQGRGYIDAPRYHERSADSMPWPVANEAGQRGEIDRRWQLRQYYLAAESSLRLSVKLALSGSISIARRIASSDAVRRPCAASA